MATWTAVNVTLKKNLKQNQGVGITPGVINYSLDFFSEILRDGFFHHNYTGSVGFPLDGDFEGLVTRTMREHLRLWSNADGIEDNGTLKIEGAISLEEVDPAQSDANAAFNKAFFDLQQLKGLASVGILASDDPSIQAALSLTQKAYLAKINVVNVIAEPPVQQKL